MKKIIAVILSLSVLALVGSCKGHGGSSGGAVTLKWNAPTTNDDGSSLTDLAGYKIHYGVVSGAYTQIVDVGNVTTYRLAGLTSGATYYFAVTAYNQAGAESDPSGEATKAIP